MGEWIAQGFGTNTYGTGATILFVAAENWTNAAHGTHILFQTTPTGSTATIEACRAWASGGFSVGSTADPGLGNLRLQGNIVIGGGAAFMSTINALSSPAPSSGTPNLGTNQPVGGAPVKWIQINDAGATRNIPTW
jgi:hypothetical protein